MTGPGQKPDYTKGEKIVNFFADIAIKGLCGVAWIVRKIRRPYWDRKR